MDAAPTTQDHVRLWVTDLGEADARAMARSLPKVRKGVRAYQLSGAVLFVVGLLYLGTAAGAAVAPIIIGVALMCSRWSTVRVWRQALTGVEGITSPKEVVLDSDGLTIMTPTASTRVLWSAWDSWVADRDGIILLLQSGVRWEWLPRRGASPQDWELVVNVVRSRLPMHKN